MSKTCKIKVKRKVVNATSFYIRHLMRPTSTIMLLLMPFIAMCIVGSGMKGASSVMVVLLLMAVALMLRFWAYANNASSEFPVPLKRYTKDTESGITVNKNELEDMVAYVCDVENYLEREGLL